MFFILNIRNIYQWCPSTWFFSNLYKQRIIWLCKIAWSDAHTPEHTSLHFTANVSLSVSLGPLFWSSETAVNSLCCQFEGHFLRGRNEATVATCVFQIQSLLSWILENLNNNQRPLAKFRDICEFSSRIWDISCLSKTNKITSIATSCLYYFLGSGVLMISKLPV